MTNPHPSPDRVEELKPCPFCGGEAKRFTIGNDEPNNAGGDCIGCGQCGASSHVEFGRKENLVSCWNTRPESESVTVMREALKWIAEVQQGTAKDCREVAREALAQIGCSE
jgi:Lar family restriction alleviation protein